MGEEFVASNGLTVVERDGNFIVSKQGYPHPKIVGTLTGYALREFFAHERDVELGWWRSPEFPNMVVWRHPLYDEVRIFDEREFAMSGTIGRNDLDAWPRFQGAAQAFFEAHPKQDPVWWSAEPGSVWDLRFEDSRGHTTLRAIVDCHKSFHTSAGTVYMLNNPLIIDAVRVA